MTRILLPAAMLGAALLLQGCVFAPDSGDHGPRAVRQVQPTLGQELLDLQRARDAGVLSEGEFDRLRDRLIDARN